LIKDDNFIRVARVTGAHALNGRLKIALISDNLSRFDAENIVFLKEKDYNPYRITGFAPLKGKTCLLQLEGIDDRNRAEALSGVEIFITRELAEETRDELEDDSFYYFDLMGCDVYLNGSLFAKVTDILEAGAGEVLVITDSRKRELMLPFVESMVDTSRIGEKRIDIHPVEGLFDI
jgi:16S rRNA processing protein RimM